MILKNISTSALRERRRQLAQDMPPTEQVMRGTLSQAYKRCGRPNCRCVDGPGHGPKYYLSYQRTQTLTVAHDRLVIVAMRSLSFSKNIQALQVVSRMSW